MQVPEIQTQRPLSAALRVGALALAALPLTGCNESSSSRLPTADIVVDGDLRVDGSRVDMRVDLGKEGSSVVVVLEGGDALRAGNGAVDLPMDYTADIFGSHYRADFPLNLAATYSATLVRADGSSARSEFPPLPAAFAITSPLPGAVLPASMTSLDIAWDITSDAEEMALDASWECGWDVNPLPAGTVNFPVHRSRGDYRTITSGERGLRRVNVNPFAFIDLQRAQLAAENPSSTVRLVSCDGLFRIYARNDAPAHVSLSSHSRMTARRIVETEARFVP